MHKWQLLITTKHICKISYLFEFWDQINRNITVGYLVRSFCFFFSLPTYIFHTPLFLLMPFIMQHGARHQLCSDKTTGTQRNSCSRLSCHFTTLSAWGKPKELLSTNITPKCLLLVQPTYCKPWTSQVLCGSKKCILVRASSYRFRIQPEAYSLE